MKTILKLTILVLMLILLVSCETPGVYEYDEVPSYRVKRLTTIESKNNVILSINDNLYDYNSLGLLERITLNSSSYYNGVISVSGKRISTIAYNTNAKLSEFAVYRDSVISQNCYKKYSFNHNNNIVEMFRESSSTPGKVFYYNGNLLVKTLEKDQSLIDSAIFKYSSNKLVHYSNADGETNFFYNKYELLDSIVDGAEVTVMQYDSKYRLSKIIVKPIEGEMDTLSINYESDKIQSLISNDSKVIIEYFKDNLPKKIIIDNYTSQKEIIYDYEIGVGDYLGHIKTIEADTYFLNSVKLPDLLVQIKLLDM